MLLQLTLNSACALTQSHTQHSQNRNGTHLYGWMPFASTKVSASRSPVRCSHFSRSGLITSSPSGRVTCSDAEHRRPLQHTGGCCCVSTAVLRLWQSTCITVCIDSCAFEKWVACSSWRGLFRYGTPSTIVGGRPPWQHGPNSRDAAAFTTKLKQTS
jgi:hypothetical protein